MQSKASKIISWLGAKRNYIVIIGMAYILTAYLFFPAPVIGNDIEKDEIMDFLKRDLTDEHMYIVNMYDCEHFAKDVQYNANTLDIRCAVVLLPSSDGDCEGIDNCFHAIVGFEVNGTMLYFEPQTDKQLYPTNIYDTIFSPWEVGTYKAYY